MIDVVIPAHIKDIETLDLCIDGIVKSVNGVRDVYVVSKDRLTDNAKWIRESSFPFSISDVSNIIGKHWRTCWYYQQLLKLYTSFVEENLTDASLFIDSDTIFINPTDFIDGDVALFNVGTENYRPYFEHMDRLVPGLHRMTEHSGITHHMVFQRDILSSLFREVENNHGCPFWEAFLKCTLGKYNTISGDQSHEGQGRAAEYEIYFNYCLMKFPERIRIRKLNSILAYKEELEKSRNSYTVGSRDNNDRHIRVIDEVVPNFTSLEESMVYAIHKCRESGYDSVTFQKHTRQGIDEYKSESVKYIMDYTNDKN